MVSTKDKHVDSYTFSFYLSILLHDSLATVCYPLNVYLPCDSALSDSTFHFSLAKIVMEHSLVLLSLFNYILFFNFIKNLKNLSKTLSSKSAVS